MFDGYDHAHLVLGSKNASLDIDVFDLDPEQLRKFDVVLFLGVLYYLKNPYGGLEKAASMARELLIVETATAFNDHPEPFLRHYENDSLDGDSSNFYVPNTKALESILREIRFLRIEIVRNPSVLVRASSAPETNTDERKLTLSERLKGKTKLPSANSTRAESTRDRHIAFAWKN